MTSSKAFPVGDSATGQCTVSTVASLTGCVSKRYEVSAVPMTITGPAGQKKDILFTPKYNCVAEKTCDYQVPYDCTNDGTCVGTANKAGWTDCNAQTAKNCKFTVRDMTLDASSIKLQNAALNSGQYASMAVAGCPTDDSCPMPKLDSGLRPRPTSNASARRR